MKLFKKNNLVENEYLPKHIGIIMDGNGRWAKKKGLPRTAGHVAGAKTFRNITKYCEKIGIQYLTVYAFSTENWKRPPEEVSAIMNLLRDYLKESLNDFKNENIVTKFIGDRSMLDSDIQELIDEAEKETMDKTGMTLCIAVNYGGRDEILHSFKEIYKEIDSGKININDVSEETINNHLYTKDIPDVDLILRPSGEYRLSNYLIWQSAYAEYVFMDVLWPDFRPEHLDQAINEYAGRHRRFGGI